MKRLLENPGILGASAILGALGIVTGAAALLWDINDTRTRNIEVAETLKIIVTRLDDLNEKSVLQGQTLDTAIVNATAARRSINEAIERRVEQLESEHRWLSNVSREASSSSNQDIPGLQVLLENLVAERRWMIHEMEGIKTQMGDEE